MSNMKSSWEKVKFGEFVQFNPYVSINKNQILPFIPMGKVVPENRYVTSNMLKKFKGGGSKFKNGDVLFARITPCLENGKITQVKDLGEGYGFGSTEFFVFREIEGISRNDFIYYLSISDEIKKNAEKSMFGASGRQRADKTAVENIKIDVPSFENQKKIASILSAYDDLIENNNRRIKILEEMAQLIYKEWFVKFRFPGHEKVRILDSKLGKTPEGWKVVNLGSVAQIFRGKSYRSKELSKNEGLPFLNLKCVNRNGGFRKEGIKWFNGDFKYSHEAFCGDIVIALTDMTQDRNIVARAARVPKMKFNKFVFSMDLVKIVPTRLIQNIFLYCFLRFSGFGDTVKQFANGANVLHLNPKFILGYKFVLPPEKIIDNYAEYVLPIFNLGDNLLMQNWDLIKIRDLLLPKLISGKIDVENVNFKET